jgi:hypothetical protein
MGINKNPVEKQLFDKLIKKSELKQTVYHSTFDSLNLLKKTIEQMSQNYQAYTKSKKGKFEIPFEVVSRSKFEIELKFGGDILLFMMHTNVFEFSRGHRVMNTSYIKEDKSRSYCGVIHIYNFLSDSFKYNRLNDVGYLIGRVFINKDKHYFIEGKRELGYLFNNFGQNVLNKEAIKTIVGAAIEYTVNFDLLTPPYENVKEVSLHEMVTALDTLSIKTGKRLGFKFQADED